jgi:hypothetical protein
VEAAAFAYAARKNPPGIRIPVKGGGGGKGILYCRREAMG